ncbi:MAG: OmpA family protein, partial [Candidatus Omnitrophica bacterium]|nr:OmpA family protein [Candidatus Omnitrophota bacterium]
MGSGSELSLAFQAVARIYGDGVKKGSDTGYSALSLNLFDKEGGTAYLQIAGGEQDGKAQMLYAGLGSDNTPIKIKQYEFRGGSKITPSIMKYGFWASIIGGGVFEMINMSAERGGVAVQYLINEGDTTVKSGKREQNIDGTLMQLFAIGKNREVDADAQETMTLGSFIDGDFTLFYEFDVSDAMEGVKKEANIVTLKRVAKYLAANPGIDVVVNGYTDRVGTDQYNQALSERRAEDFAAALRSMLDVLGVSGDRVKAVGHGEKYANVPEEEVSADHAKGAEDRKTVFSFAASTTGKLEGIHAADRKSSTMTFEVDEHGLITNDEIRGFGVYDESPGVSNRVMLLAKGKADEGSVAVAAGGKMIGDGGHISGTRAWGEDVDAALLANNSNTRILGLRDFS